jgi:flagellar biosynthesis/type III secretory pathway M-ring protein FliF/YscJ
MGIALAVVGLLLLGVLIWLAVTITGNRRRQVAAYTPEQRRLQSIRGGLMRLEEGLASLDDAAHEPDARPELKDGHALARERTEQARAALAAEEPERAAELIAEGGRALDAGRRALYAGSRTEAPAPDWPT